MIEKRTVFVLGAGASCPYGFPAAVDLRQQILSDFEDRYASFADRPGSQTFVNRMVQGYPNLAHVREFLTRFRLSTTPSVDLFLARNPYFAVIGKIAICLSILHAEKYSRFREEVKKPEHDWYRYLYEKLTRELTDKCSLQEFHKNNVAFVTFNYDRSLEHFLFESLLYSFEDASADTVREQLARIPFIHIYGKPAPLPWEVPDPQKGLDYARNIDDLSYLNVRGLIDNIRVVHEQHKSPQLESAHEQISTAERIFFLGFGYAEENLATLGFPAVLQPRHRIYGTAMGWTRKEVEDLSGDLVRTLQQRGNKSASVGSQVEVHARDCVGLLREFL